MFACSPSPHLSPSKTTCTTRKKRCLWGCQFTPLQQNAKIRTMKLQRRSCDMKKAIQFMLLAALVVSVSGCANTNHPQAIRESSDIEALRSEIDENAVPKETLTDSFSESKTSSDDSVIDVKAETESSQAETPQPTAEQALRWGYNRRRQSFQTIRRNPNRRKPLSLPLNQSQRQRSSQHSNRQKKNQRRNLH